MKKVLVTGAEKINVVNDLRSINKVAEAEGENLVVSDGYHTFDELYDHRITLYIALAKFANDDDFRKMEQVKFLRGFAWRKEDWTRAVWRSKVHSDGSTFDGWFVLGLGREAGKQITYHLPDARWDECAFAETLDKSPDFDGHTSADVLARIKAL